MIAIIPNFNNPYFQTGPTRCTKIHIKLKDFDIHVAIRIQWAPSEWY